MAKKVKVDLNNPPKSYLTNGKYIPAPIIQPSDNMIEFVEDFGDRYDKINNTNKKEFIVDRIKHDNPIIGGLSTTTDGRYDRENDQIILQNPLDESAYAHEIAHKLNDSYYINLQRSQEERELIRKAYDTINGEWYPGQLDLERFATNTGLRKTISEMYNNALGKELDNIILNLHPSVLLNLYDKENGYTNKNDYMTYTKDMQDIESWYNKIYGSFGKIYKDLSEEEKSKMKKLYDSKTTHAGLKIDKDKINVLKEALIKIAKVENNNKKSDTYHARYGVELKENKPFKLKGGIAVPLDNKKRLFYLSGAKHEQGGIDVTPELEAEGGEVIKVNPKSIKVVTAQKIMGGKSPAELVVDASSTGEQDKVFNKVFKYQEDFKDRNNLNDDGTKKAQFGKEKSIDEMNSEMLFLPTKKENIDQNKNTLVYKTYPKNYVEVPRRINIEKDLVAGLHDITNDIIEGKYSLYQNHSYHKNRFLKDKQTGKIYEDIFSDIDPIDLSYFDVTPYSEIRKMLPKRDYIGGSKREVGIKVINKVPGLKDEILKLSKVYGISPNVFTNRLINEGWVQQIAHGYNIASPKGQKEYRWDRMNDFVDGFNSLGLDTFGNHHKAGHLNLRRDIKYDDRFNTNEDGTGRVYNSAAFDNMYDALEAKAAMIEYLTKLGKNKGHSGSDLDAWVNAAYNMGEYHKDLNNMDYVRQKYGVKPYYRYGGQMKKQYKIGGIANVSSTGKKLKAKLGLNTGDWINLGLNSAGALTNLITGLATPNIRYARMKDTTPVIAPKINANVNTNAEESAIDQQYYDELNAINENTSNSQVALNRKRNAAARRAAAKVKVRSAAENTRRDLINKGNILKREYDKFNIQRQDQIDAYNAQADAAEFNANRTKVGDAITGFVSDLGLGASTILNTAEKREADRNNAILTYMANPNINLTEFDKGYKDIYKQLFLQDTIDDINKRKTKIQNRINWSDKRKNRVIKRLDRRLINLGTL